MCQSLANDCGSKIKNKFSEKYSVLKNRIEKINEIFRSKNYRKITKIIFLRYERYFGSVVVLEELNIILGAVIGTKLVHLATKTLSK